MKLRLVLLAALTLLWLVPCFLAGSLGRLPVKVPPWLSLQYTAGGLFFTSRTDKWAQTQVQVHRRGTSNWQTIDTAQFSPMGTFGYRQRLDRVLQETNGKPAADGARQRLAEWIARRDEQVYPDSPGVMAVRFGATVWAANSPELARPSGHWLPDPPTGRPLVPFHPLSAYFLKEGKALPMAPRAVAQSKTGPSKTMQPKAGVPKPPPIDVGKRFKRIEPPSAPGTPAPPSNAAPVDPPVVSPTPKPQNP